MIKDQLKKLSLDSFKAKHSKNADAVNLARIAGGILGSCHSCVTYVSPANGVTDKIEWTVTYCVDTGR
jgi:hypothetical protein